MKFLRRYGPALLMVLTSLGLAAFLLFPELADARVGGGQGSSRGGGSSGGGSGGGGNAGDLIVLLIYLCIEVPIVGVPLTIGVVGFFIAQAIWRSKSKGHRVHRTHAQREYTSAAPTRTVPGLAALKKRDTGLSIPVLLDYLVLVHRRAHEALGSKLWEPLAPFVSPAARTRIEAGNQGVTEISDVVVGGVRLIKIERRKDFDHLYVQLDSTRTEHLSTGKERRVEVKEQWTFRRARDATSLAPEKVERLGCPNCGASIEVTNLGACRNCDSPITAGQLQWQATFVVVSSRRRAIIPDVGWVEGGDESSVDVPVLQDSDLAARLRELTARHPDFDPEVFGKRVELIYTRLQAAWSDGKWAVARPYLTDRMFQTLRFYVERYTKHGLQNRLEDVELLRVRLVKVELDAWYESVTVRLWGSMKDSIVDNNGKVIGGNAKTARRFSEYWTFLRAAGGEGGSQGDQDRCPSCGAPLDQISQAGICGYCSSKITTGKFDWVLTRIDQPESYAG